MDKALVRRELRGLVHTLTVEQKALKSRLACRHLSGLPCFAEASVVMMFLSLPEEVDTMEAIALAWSAGKTVVVPKVRWEKCVMVPVVIDSLDRGLRMDRGIRSPIEERSVAPETLDLVVVPGMGFDRNGCRLGRGGGFYDRFLAQSVLSAVRVGLCFAEQVVDSIPVAEHDQPVDWVVSDRHVIDVKDEKGASDGS